MSRDNAAASKALESAIAADHQDEDEAVLLWFGAAVAALSGDADKADKMLARVTEGASADVRSARTLSDMFPAIEGCCSAHVAESLKKAASLLTGDS